jgi:hypothetical protein
MIVIKSKINSLAWLKSSAICSSVVGGVILFSKPAASAQINITSKETETSAIISISHVFEGGYNSIRYSGSYWNAFFEINETQGSLVTNDELSVSVVLRHIKAPHQGENSLGIPLGLDIKFDAGGIPSNQAKITRDATPFTHPGSNHLDKATGTLTAILKHNFLSGDDIEGTWNFTVNAQHVPEPTTMLGAAVALGWGGWLKRNNSIKQNKTKSQD